MLVIDLQNVEETIFYNSSVVKLLNPYFKDLIDLWKKSKQLSKFKHIVQDCLIQFLDTCSDEHVQILSNYFKTPVQIISVDNSIVENKECEIVDLKTMLKNNLSNISLFRNKNKIKITRWK